MKKSKIFARKIVAIILSVIMAMSTFTGVLTVYATSKDDAHDSQLAANFMTWAETTDNQTCEALLDWVDDVLGSANIAPISLNLNYVVVVVNINGYLDSVDGALDLVRQVRDLLSKYGGTVGGDVAKLSVDPLANLKYSENAADITSQCNKSYRAVNDAKDIVMALAETLYYNSNNDKTSKRQNQNVIGSFLSGNLNLGVAKSFLDVYNMIGNIGGLNMWNGYQSNLVYNLVAQVIFNNTNWFTNEEAEQFRLGLQGKGGKTWNYDEQLLSKLTSEFISKISIEMTYAISTNKKTEDGTNFDVTDSSKTRYQEIKAWLKAENLDDTDANIARASEALGYDPNLRYDKNGNGMIYLFRYGKADGGEETLTITPQDTFYTILDRAFKLAWKTGLKPTLKTMRVNNSMDWYKGHGGNFDNVYYYWLKKNDKIDKTDWVNNYTDEKFDAFLAAEYKEYGCSSVEEFRNKVRKTFDYDRNVVEDPQYNWRDVAKSNNYVTSEGSTESILFGKLRYSPLADKVFNMQTGPINLYFMQTGFKNLEHFVDSYVNNNNTVDGKRYNNIVAALNNCLVAAVKDLFPNSDNIGLGEKNVVKTIIDRPTLQETSADPSNLEIAQTIVTNLCSIFEYGANVTDENILNAFYNNHSIVDKTTSNHLSEENFEEAMMPLLIGTLGVIKAIRSIHNEEFDLVKDAKGLAYVVLKEHLSYSQPDKNYDQFVTTKNGYYEAALDIDGDGNKTMFEDALLPMARDAVGYFLNALIPIRTKDGKVWNYEAIKDPTKDKTTLYDIVNSVICYYASMDEYTEPSYNLTATSTIGKGVAALLGVVNADGSCDVSINNDIWTNISNIANKIWPTIGVLQYGTTAKAGHADAKDLLYNTIITSVLDIKQTHGADQTRGLTTLIKQLLTIFTAEPIMSKGIDALIYDEVVASLVNSIFGAKVTGQQYKQVIPTSSEMGTTTPFDRLVDQAVLVKYKGDGQKETGVLGILISNIFCAFGGTTAVQNKTRGDGCWQGAMFAVKAVSYFVNGFLPQLRDHQFGAASISINDPSRSDFSFGTDIKNTYITIKNESVGLNKFYKDTNGNIVPDDRYFVELVNLESSDGTIAANLPTKNYMLAPEKSLKLKVNGKYPQTSQKIKYTLTYNIYKGTSDNPKKSGAKPLYENQIAVCYLNLSTDKGWYGSLNKKDERTEAVYSTGAYTQTPYGYKMNKQLVSSSLTGQLESLGIGLNGNVDGVYEAYNNAQDENDRCNGMAYTSYQVDGDKIQVTNINKYDYSLDGGTTWHSGDIVELDENHSFAKGYTLDEAKAQTEVNGVTKPNASTRTHIAAEISKSEYLNNINDPDYYEGVELKFDENGDLVNVFVDPVAIQNTCATPMSTVPNVYYVSLKGVASANKRYMKVKDQVKTLTPGVYNINLVGYSATDTALDLGDNTVLTIADTSGSATLQSAYQSAQGQINAYQPSNYTDYVEASNSSAIYLDMQSKFETVLDKIVTAPTERNIEDLTSKTQLTAKTSTTKASTGDPAYKPLTDADLNADDTLKTYVENKFHKNGNYYYVDEAFKFPIYSNKLIVGEDVTDGTEKYFNRKVEMQGGVYYYVNDYVYENGWDTTSYAYPYYGPTKTIATYEEMVNGVATKKNYYAKENHSYYASTGKSVNASEGWTFTHAELHDAVIPNDGKNDYRSVYAQAQDFMTYYVQETIKKIDTSAMNEIVQKDGIIDSYKGKEIINYDIASYQKMTQVGKEAEALLKDTGAKDENGKPVYTTTASYAQLHEASENFKFYNSRLVPREYKGQKLEAEIALVTGTTKANLTATVSEDETTHALSNGEVTVTGTPTVKYGKVVNGKLVNQGAVVYSDATWTEYINRLAKAIKVAKEEKEANISSIYEAKKSLVMAENALAVPDPNAGFTISGTVTEAIDATGKAGTFALVGASIVADGEVVANTKADGSFTAEVPAGTTSITVKATNGINRTVPVSGATEGLNIGVIAIDYNGDGKVNSTDVALASKAGEIGEGKKITADQFKKILRAKIAYSNTLA